MTHRWSVSLFGLLERHFDVLGKIFVAFVSHESESDQSEEILEHFIPPGCFRGLVVGVEI